MKRLELELVGEGLDYRKSSNLQGVLYEHISPEYVEVLHYKEIHPFSQYLYKVGERFIWRIQTLTDEAAREIIEPLLDASFSEFTFRKSRNVIKIVSKKVTVLTQEELMEEFNYAPSEHFFQVEFLTPTSFKQQGRYFMWPDLRLIYQSLMNKYSSVLPDTSMMDEETLDYMAANSEIVRYKIQSVDFPLEGIKIYSFRGTIKIKVRGADTMANYIRMLLKFGEYSGVGIKTAIGMGAIHIRKGDTSRER